MTASTQIASVSELLKNNADFVIENDIPRQKTLYSDAQSQTADTFGFKWEKRDTFESPDFQNMAREWLQERYQMPGKALAEVIEGKRILDAGCGAGHSAALLFSDSLKTSQYVGVDISTAVDVAQKRFEEKGYPAEFVQASLLEIPEEIGNFDVVFSEGVMHHTDCTKDAFLALAKRVNKDGYFMFYIYRQKGPIREYTDDYIRDKIAPMTDEQAWNALEPLSKLGKQLGDLNIELNIEEAIEVLDIPAGKINLQRLFYWHIFKAFYRPEFTLDEMNHINFDWYRPTNAHRHTVAEVQAWLKEAGLTEVVIKPEDAGITVIAQNK